jgi:signal transduction histidine kinase
LMTNSGVKLVLDNVDESLIVMNDWSRISQILASLLNNAVKFTSAGSIHFGFTTHHNIIKFYVKDTGIGIPTHLVATIFKSFGKVDPFIQGSGLGLTLCRLLVEKMGGQIWVRSKENEGSIFYFTLPVTE